MRERTPVDDVRRVREKLSARFDNDVDQLAEYVHEVARELRGKLGLRPVPGDDRK
jgi:hypothetical protein